MIKSLGYPGFFVTIDLTSVSIFESVISAPQIIMIYEVSIAVGFKHQ